jgi:hypothetical protein
MFSVKVKNLINNITLGCPPGGKVTLPMDILQKNIPGQMVLAGDW